MLKEREMFICAGKKYATLLKYADIFSLFTDCRSVWGFSCYKATTFGSWSAGCRASKGVFCQSCETIRNLNDILSSILKISAYADIKMFRMCVFHREILNVV